MRRIFVLAAILALALPAVAAAQEHKDEHKGPPPGAGGHPPPPHPQFKPAPPHGPGPGPQFKKPGPPGPHPPGPPGPAFQPNHPPGPPGPGPGPGPQHFSWHGHQFQQFHPAHPFIYPPGWAYRQWAVGAILPPLFLVPDYYFMDWVDLGLPPPPPGAQYVRYGPDLLLVDVSTGQIIDVIPGVFY